MLEPPLHHLEVEAIQFGSVQAKRVQSKRV